MHIILISPLPHVKTWILTQDSEKAWKFTSKNLLHTSVYRCFRPQQLLFAKISKIRICGKMTCFYRFPLSSIKQTWFLMPDSVVAWKEASEFLTRLSSQSKSHESFEMGYVASEFESRVFCSVGEFCSKCHSEHMRYLRSSQNAHKKTWTISKKTFRTWKNVELKRCWNDWLWSFEAL